MARNLEALTISDENLNVTKGNIFNSETSQDELSKFDLVISTLGKGVSRKLTEIYSKGGHQVVTLMQKANVKRLIK